MSLQGLVGVTIVEPDEHMRASWATFDASRLAERDAAFDPALSRIWRVCVDRPDGSSAWAYVARGVNSKIEGALEEHHFLGLEICPADDEELAALRELLST